MTDIATLRTSVLGIEADATPEQIVDVLGRVEVALKALKEIKALAEERILERVRESGAFQVGDVRYYEGSKKSVKCTDVAGTAEALLAAIGGDLKEFSSFMGSQPWKYGALRTLLGEERWAQLFREDVEVDLKTGKAVKELKIVDQRFLPPRKGTA